MTITGPGSLASREPVGLRVRLALVFVTVAVLAVGLVAAFDGYERTVDSHVKNLRRKIEDDPANPQIVQTVLGGGYRLGLVRDG